MRNSQSIAHRFDVLSLARSRLLFHKVIDRAYDRAPLARSRRLSMISLDDAGS